MRVLTHIDWLTVGRINASPLYSDLSLPQRNDKIGPTMNF